MAPHSCRSTSPLARTSSWSRVSSRKNSVRPHRSRAQRLRTPSSQLFSQHSASWEITARLLRRDWLSSAVSFSWKMAELRRWSTTTLSPSSRSTRTFTVAQVSLRLSLLVCFCKTITSSDLSLLTVADAYMLSYREITERYYRRSKSSSQRSIVREVSLRCVSPDWERRRERITWQRSPSWPLPTSSPTTCLTSRDSFWRVTQTSSSSYMKILILVSRRLSFRWSTFLTEVKMVSMRQSLLRQKPSRT